MIFSTKAQTLLELRDVLTTARVPELVVLTCATWWKERDICLQRVLESLESRLLIVRSSAKLEDQHGNSKAGAFLSLKDITELTLGSAIDSVIASYERAAPEDEILIMPMLQNVKRAGVAFTHDPNSGSPTRTVNWVDSSDTGAITSGVDGRLWQQAAYSPKTLTSPVQGVVNLLDELLLIFNEVPLECEFATTEVEGEEVLWLLQARALSLQVEREDSETQRQRLEIVSQKVLRGLQPHPFLLGRRTVYGVMPDWNPAEIIGIRPRPLALSLYREMITDSIWAYQRSNYGYRNLRGFPLMLHFFGMPYVDVRVSFNSFVPADLDEALGGRLVDYYVDRLIAQPALHDKIEFEIVFSCYSFDLAERLSPLTEAGFRPAELDALTSSLRRLTRRIIDPSHGLWQSDAARLQVLEARRSQLYALNSDPLQRVYWLLEDGKRYGTLPFAGLARAGFIAVQLLRSLVAAGLLSEADREHFMGSVSTVNGQLMRDRALLDKSTFLARYGHLRPGTYDILSRRYDESPNDYFDWSQKPEPPRASNPIAFTVSQLRAISQLLDEHGLHADPVALFEFIQAGIELRELAKFHFSRNLSDSLSLIADWGGQHGFSPEDLSYSDASVFKELHIAGVEEKGTLESSIEQGRRLYEQTCRLSLPPLITSSEDVWGFEWPEVSPNFITQKQVVAPVSLGRDLIQLSGSIVCIPSADPGYDWLFSYPISGLITAWGGANSHMAIRASELHLPAVIGAGEIHFRKWSQASRLLIDCAGKRVEVIS